MDTPQLLFCHLSSRKVKQTESKSLDHKSVLTHNYPNIIHKKVGDVILIQGWDGAIDPNWCLLDNKSTCNALMKHKYLQNTRKVPNGWVLHVHCNVRTTVTYLIGDLPSFDDPTWYNPYRVENILSLNLICKRFIVTYDSE